MAKDLNLDLEDIKVGGDEKNVENFQETAFTDTSDHKSTTTIDTGAPITSDIKIGDRKAPIVMLFGPPSSGKSMTLVRLARYLKDQNYTVEPDLTFKSDASYKECCKNFKANLSSKDALKSTGRDEFLMVQVRFKGRLICQILEAPGEDYYDPLHPDATSNDKFRPYLTKIIRKLNNRKIWVFIAESMWDKQDHIPAYVERISSCKRLLMKNSDRAILLYNKIDNKSDLFDHTHINISLAKTEMNNEYHGLGEIFKNENPITSLWRPYNYFFVPFSTGSYHDKVGTLIKEYVESDDVYPKGLWNTISKSIKG